MKHVCILLLLLLAALPVLGQNLDIGLMFHPQGVYVNSFKTASFDPETPWTQPVLTDLNIWNASDESFRFYMKVEVFWSGIEGSLVEAKYLSNTALAAGEHFFLTNQDLISNQASSYFNQQGPIDFSLEDIIERSDILKRAVMAGYFPDGVISIKVSVQPESLGVDNWSDASIATFPITIRNSGVIYAISPGVPIGGTPTQISENPVSFLWNSMDTGFNDYQITIREYSQNNPPMAGSINNTGRVFYQNVMSDRSYSFTEFLPYTPGNYYAWQISTARFTELHPNKDYGPWSKESEDYQISSEWNVFQYVSDGNHGDNIQSISASLLTLKDPRLSELLGSGFVPTGKVIFKGKEIEGNSTSDLFKNILNRDYKIRIWE